MSGFLYQIENRQKRQMDNQNGSKRRPAKPDPHGRKTVGVKVGPKLYSRLVRLKEQRNLSSIAKAVAVAAEEGLRHLLR